MPPRASSSLLIPIPQGYSSLASGLYLSKPLSPSALNMRFYGPELRNIPAAQLFADGPLTTGVTTLNNPVTGLYFYERWNRATHTLAATRNKIYRYSGSPSVDEWLDITGADAAFTGTLDTDPWDFTALQDATSEAIYFSNGVGWDTGGATNTGIWKWTGTDNVQRVLDGGFPHAARLLTSYANRVIAADIYDGTKTFADRIRWSAYGNGDLWNTGTNPTAGFADLIDFPGAITGLQTGGPYCLVWKRNVIYRVIETGLVTPAFALQIAVVGTGSIAARSCIFARGRFFFLGEDDVYTYDGSSSPTSIGAPIKDELFRELNYERLRQVVGVHYPQLGEYWLCIPTGTSTFANKAWVYNYLFDTWSPIQWSATATSFARLGTGTATWDDDSGTWDSATDTWDTSATFTSAETTFPIFGRSNAKVYKFDEAGVATAIASGNAYVTTQDSHLDRPGLAKTVDRVRIIGRTVTQSTIRLSLSTDGGRTWASQAEAVWPSSSITSGLATLMLSVPRITGDYFRLRLDCDGGIAVAGFVLDYITREETR